MSENTQKQLVSVVSTAVAFLVASRLAGKIVDQPEARGVSDDVKEALVQALFSLVSTLLASLVIRRIIAGR